MKSNDNKSSQHFKLKKSLMTLICNLYVKFLYTITFGKKLTMLLIVIGLYLIFVKLDLLFVISAIYLSVSIFLLRPFMYYSVYSNNSDNDKVSKFLEKHCTSETFELFKKLKEENKKQYLKDKKK